MARIEPPQSIWRAVTAAGPECPALEGEARADVVIIGAGFAGLSTALHLREAGADVIVLEAVEPGWGGSGRNNGQVIPILSGPDPEDIEARYGEAGERFVRLLQGSASTLFELAARCGIDAEAEQTGWIQPVHSPGRIRIAERRWRQWQARGAPVELLDRDAVRRMTGSSAWFGGFWNTSGGHINPLALARGLARTVLSMGARVHGHTPALAFEREGDHWVVRTPKGQVHSRALLLATNAYTDAFAPRLAPRVAAEVVPVRSWQMATQPLSEAVRRQIIPGRQAVSDTHRDLYFMRYDARNRLVTGGSLVFARGARHRLERMVGQRLQRLWPEIGPVRFDHVWSGWVAMTPDFLPRFHRLGPDAWAWAGCNGRAVALTVALGGEFARALGGTPEHELALPLTPVRPVPLQAIARRVAPLMLARYRQLDRREI